MQETNKFIIAGNWNKYVTFENEKLLVVQRQHWFTIVFPLILCSLGGIFCIGFSIFMYSTFFPYPKLLFIICSTLLVLLGLIALKNVADWYFHIYLITNRKIIDVCYIPLSSHMVNDIMLDQVRCTEIDIQKQGIINELVDMSSVVLTFDRPTHQEWFALEHIAQGDEIANILTKEWIAQQKHLLYQPEWYKTKNGNMRFTEELYPGW